MRQTNFLLPLSIVENCEAYWNESVYRVDGAIYKDFCEILSYDVTGCAWDGSKGASTKHHTKCPITWEWNAIWLNWKSHSSLQCFEHTSQWCNKK